MNTDRKIDIDAEVIALRNPRRETTHDFQVRASILNYQLHVADTVSNLPRPTTTNHGSKVS